MYFIFCLIFPESSDKTAETPGPSTQKKAKKRLHSASEVLECDQDINKIKTKKLKLECRKLKLEIALLKAECMAKRVVVESSESESD